MLRFVGLAIEIRSRSGKTEGEEKATKRAWGARLDSRLVVVVASESLVVSQERKIVVDRVCLWNPEPRQKSVR